MVASFEAEGLAIVGLDVDPTDPDRVYVIFRNGNVRSSQDGGLTWSDLGTPDEDFAHGLVLGVDHMYAAVGGSVMRCPCADALI